MKRNQKKMKDREANECNQWREVFRAPSELDEISACLRFPNLVKSNNSLQFSECMLDEVKSVGRRRGRLTDARRLVSHHLGRQHCSRTAGSDATRGL